MARGWRIVSGGQTGVDRAALDVARVLGLAHGGHVPKGRRAEDGALPDDYGGMSETASRDYSERTRLNVRDSEATLILTRGGIDGGTRLPLETARALGRPVLCVDVGEAGAVERIGAWLGGMAPGTVNVAGPRESEAAGIYGEAYAVLRGVFEAG